MNKEYTKILAFAHAHRGEDPLRLLLQQKRHPDIDLKLVAQQLEGLRQAAIKWPTLAECTDFVYPPRLNREQSSSEAAARYKAGLFAALGGGTLADLTGGMGVDAYFMSMHATHADYYEMDSDLCHLAEHNYAALGADNIQCHCADSMSIVERLEPRDLIFIDPARRDRQGKKVAAFEECTPNLLGYLGLLRTKCRHLMVKASPMVDIHLGVKQLESVQDVYVVAVEGECKEVLFVVRGAGQGPRHAEPTIHCTNIDRQRVPEEYSYIWSEEEETLPSFALEVGQYLYEPNASLMKGGCYNSIGCWFGLKKLARNTHLYTSNEYLKDFPGRVFRVLRPLTLTAKEVGHHIPEGKAHVVVRNYPSTAAELQKRLRLKEGGSLYVIAATLGRQPQGWLCEAV
ncbi:MAG: SAM-dependent methyltransferase [Bacteroidales bacterium]|nr:SAM-dependent methyltransferase [Bacteroidales bacterium]